MFISTKHLVEQYGVDETIARYFVDRDPPVGNLYWHEKLLYLRPAPGYLFIPLIIDLLYKLGLNKEELLGEEFVTIMEGIGHISALEETDKISRLESIKQCEQLVKPTCKNIKWLAVVNDYYAGNADNLFKKRERSLKTLHRGDIFLFALCALEFDDSLFEKVAEQWFALITLLLLLDDADDFDGDKESGDENAYIESELTEEGKQRLAEIVSQGLKDIEPVNHKLSKALEVQFQLIDKMTFTL